MADTKSSKSTPQGKTPTFTEENTPRHKLLAMGQKAGVEPKGKPTTKW